jgi:hypothetical protein
MMLGRLRGSLTAVAVAFGAAGVFACSDRSEVTAPTDGPEFAGGGAQGPDLRAALAAKARYTDQLLKQQGVAGTAVGLGRAGNAVVKVYLVRPGAASVAKSLDGVPVETEVTGEFRAILPSAQPGPSEGINPKLRFDRPVPIGVSAGNFNDLLYLKAFCTTGTLGARLKGANGNYYGLSNNHVFAVENLAQNGDPIIQPGQADQRCRAPATDQIGTLAGFVPLVFGRGTNLVDAAAALVTTATVDNQTPSNGYGRPSSRTVEATLNMGVQKYGRTTVLTQGTVTGVDAAVKVLYSRGLATFLHQVIITGTGGSFSNSGDSGALIVTDNRRANPVALLFAGSGTRTIGNPINAVLSELGNQLGTTLTLE